jgi:outer membrane murein-binding lipoprotein Lpp
MINLKSKTTALAVAGAFIIGMPLYGYYAMRSHFEGRVNALDSEVQALRSQSTTKVQELSADLNYIAEKMDITTRDLDQARKLAETLKQENAQASQRFRTQLAGQTKAVDKLRQESTFRLEEVRQDTTSKIGAVTGEVQTVRVDLDATKNDLAASRKEIGDVRDQIAHNSSELAELRKRGERNYVEFDIRKSKNTERIGDIQVQLKKADTKRQKYDVLLLVDDSKIEKKERTANEPVTFLVGRDRLRYELVVNYVDKDRIRGYMSTPKDKLLSAEGPTLRRER